MAIPETKSFAVNKLLAAVAAKTLATPVDSLVTGFNLEAYQRWQMAAVPGTTVYCCGSWNWQFSTKLMACFLVSNVIDIGLSIVQGSGTGPKLYIVMKKKSTESTEAYSESLICYRF